MKYHSINRRNIPRAHPEVSDDTDDEEPTNTGMNTQNDTQNDTRESSRANSPLPTEHNREEANECVKSILIMKYKSDSR